MTESTDHGQVNMAAVHRLVVAMASLVNNALHHYWFSGSDEAQAVDVCYRTLTGILDSCQVLAFQIMSDTLFVNSNAINRELPHVQTLIHHLDDLDVYNFSIRQGISRDDFGKLVEIIDARASEIKLLGGFQKLIEDFGISNVEAKKLILTELAEEDTVVSKEAAAQAGDGPGQAGDGPGQDSDSPNDQMAGSILAFLKGDIPADDEKARKDVSEVASDPAKMADLILRTAEVHQKAADIEQGETMSDFVVGCLRRVHEGVSLTREYKSKVGKKRVARNLILLEKEILDRMRDIAGDQDEEGRAIISDAILEMTDEIKMDSLADEYMTKRHAAETSEEQLVGLMLNEGQSGNEQHGLKDKLMTRGLTAAGWQELVIKSGGDESMGKGAGSAAPDIFGGMTGLGIGPDGTGSTNAGLLMVVEAITHLKMLLDRMETQFYQTGEPAGEEQTEELLDGLATVNEQVQQTTVETGEKIKELVDNIRIGDGAAPSTTSGEEQESTTAEVTGQAVLQQVTKLIERLKEPVAVLRTSIDIVHSKTLGGVNDKQDSVLKVAEDNAARIDQLIDDLRQMSSSGTDAGGDHT